MTHQENRLFTIRAFLTKKKPKPAPRPTLALRLLVLSLATLAFGLLGDALGDVAKASSAQPHTQSPRLLFIGDSLTEGYGVSRTEAYPHIVAQQLKKRGYSQLSYINGAASGATSSIGPKMVSFQLKKSRPDVVVYALGSNDGLRGVKPTETRKRINAALDILAQHKVPVLLTGQRAAPNYGPAYTKAFDSMFAEIAKERSIAFLPFLLKGVAGETALNLADGIHPNAAGHKVIAGRVADALEPLIKALPATPNTQGPATTKTKNKK